MDDLKNKPDEYWKKRLTPLEYKILRKKGTEPAFSGEHNDTKERGIYFCKGCGAELFDSDSKFDSGTGWPSFFKPVGEGAIVEESDNSLLTRRTEVLCSKCGGHLGHVFPDGPEKTTDGKDATGLRYCINSGALDFKDKEKS